MRNVFRNPDLQKQFNKTGYVVVDLLSPSEVDELLHLYEAIDGVKGTLRTNKDNTYELSFFEKDVLSKRRKFDAMYNFFKPHLDRFLDNYKPIIINLFNKQQGIGEVPVHQNWTFVDERQFTSVSVWCPLQDVSRKNGTLEVVPGSHKVICDYRGPSIPWVFDNLSEIMKEKYMVPLELRAGQVGIIDDGVIHYSGNNHTSDDRRAVQLIMKPAEAPTIHCYKDEVDDNIIHILEVDDDFFFDFNMWDKPRGGRKLNSIRYPIKKLTEQELLERCNRNLAAMV
ncbi:MAG: hypothetical protein KatS3mg031_1991 [Chitinophagales bacterium]|nr:MAG: hypothetical protein KatS3mg031_1991 [Chitinophagales bacterium]